MLTRSTDLLRSYIDGKYFLKDTVSSGCEELVFVALAPDDSRVLLQLRRGGLEVPHSWLLAVETSKTIPYEHLIRYRDCGHAVAEGQSYTYLVSEPVEDRLEEVLAERPLTEDETEAAVRAALSAIDHLHRHGYAHFDIRPGAIVAAGGLIKLTCDSIGEAGSDETAAKRARAADLIALGETVTELLSGTPDTSPRRALPRRFAEFVHATVGTSECPSPTAAQLLGLLDGKPLTSPPEVVPDAAPEAPVQPVYADEPLPVATEAGRRRGTVLVAIISVLVLALLVFFGRRRAPSEPEPTPIATPQATAQNPETKPSPARPSRPAPAPRTQGQGRWAVIAATYSSHAGASKRASQIASQSRGVHPTVLPAEGQGPPYYVVLGTATNRKEADRLRARVRGAGVPRDTYVTRIQF